MGGMSWKLTNRQREYRRYLKTPHWSALREAALFRDQDRCVECGSKADLHVHHVRYREKPEDSTLDDLQTLCKKCHRAEHGIGPDACRRQMFRVRDLLRTTKAVKDRIDRDEWIKLRKLLASPEDWKDFASLVGPHVGDISGKWDVGRLVCYNLEQRAEELRKDLGDVR